MTFNARWHRDTRQAYRIGAVFAYSADLVDWLKPVAPILHEVVVMHDSKLPRIDTTALKDMGATLMYHPIDDMESGLESLNAGIGCTSARWTLHLTTQDTVQGLESLDAVVADLNKVDASAGLVQVEYQNINRPEVRLFRRSDYCLGKTGVIPAFKRIDKPRLEIESIHIATNQSIALKPPLAHIANASKASKETAYFELIKASIGLLSQAEHHTAVYLLNQAVKLNKYRPEAYHYLSDAYLTLKQVRLAKWAKSQIKPLFAKNWESEWINIV